MSATTHKTVLIADDSVLMRQIIRDTLTAAGWTVVGEAAHGQEAVEKFHELQPAAMTLDLVMPQYDGRHALRGVMAAHPQAKVVVCSALDQTDVLKEAFQLGATDFVVKPFDRQQLVRTLDALLA